MTRPVLLRAAARRDLLAAASWYEQQPESFPQVYGDLRRALMRRFPFGVFFRPEPARLVVLAVLHASRDPRRWKRRGGWGLGAAGGVCWDESIVGGGMAAR